MRYVYLDNAATTKTAEEVVEFMQEVFTEKYGNASSFHKKGREAKQLLEWARDVIAKKVKAKSESVIFTSGGTESNNLAIKGLAFHELIKNKAKKIDMEREKNSKELRSVSDPSALSLIHI